MALRYIKCNLCESDDYIVKFKVHNIFNVVTCRKCGFSYVNPRLDDDELTQLYGPEYFHLEENNKGNKKASNGYRQIYEGWEYPEDYSKRIKEKRYYHRMKMINSFKNRGRILDVGCGGGFMLDVAREQGWEVVGTEYSEVAAEFARKNLNLRVYPGKLKSIKELLNEKKFDVISFWGVLEHVDDPLENLLIAKNYLSNDGIIAVCVPDIGCLSAKIAGKDWELAWCSGHQFFWTKKTITKMLSKAGYSIIKITNISWGFRDSDSKVIVWIQYYKDYLKWLLGALLAKLYLKSGKRIDLLNISEKNSIWRKNSIKAHGDGAMVVFAKLRKHQL